METSEELVARFKNFQDAIRAENARHEKEMKLITEKKWKDIING